MSCDCDCDCDCDLLWRSQMSAVRLWRKHHPGNDLVLPDMAQMTDWLVERAQRPTIKDAAAALLDALETQSRTTGADWGAIFDAVELASEGENKIRGSNGILVALRALADQSDTPSPTPHDCAADRP